jgi:SAM-dependent methyltransferase
MLRPDYDLIGRTYNTGRRSDPRIAAAIEAALGDARTLVNVGAGTGSYEPTGRDVTAVEPSSVMIAQRPPSSAQAVQADAEKLPFADKGFDAAMAIVSDHHWRDREAGLTEMLRVARQRVVLLNADPSLAQRFWLTSEYLPGFAELIPERYREPGYWEQELRHLLGDLEVRSVPIPHDCKDGFYQAYWRRPHAYLDPRVRDSISVFHHLPAPEVDRAAEQLRHDLDSGTWQERHHRLFDKQELDLGLRLIVAEMR